MKKKTPVNWMVIFLFIALTIGSLYRFNGLWNREIWYDEALDIAQSEKSLAVTAKEVQTPLHYFVVHFFVFLGKNTFTLGLPSALLGIASIYLVFLIGKKLFDERVGLIAAILTAISPMLIEFSQQILHYSYFVFFTLAGLYFYSDVIMTPEGKKTKFVSAFLFFLISGLNFLTHPSSFMVFALEISYAFLKLILSGGLKKIIGKSLLFVIPVFAILALITFRFGGEHGGYLQILKDVSFSFNKPMSVGYSLTGQLGNNLLVFNLKFFQAMFSWFGLGLGFRLWIYIILGLGGISYLLSNKKISILVFFTHWIVTPFVLLYFFKMSRWFEEKYFIFIIPIYLILVSIGTVTFSKWLTEALVLVDKRIKVHFKKFPKVDPGLTNLICLTVVMVLIVFLSIGPNKVRTVYGFKRSDDPGYRWSDVYNFLLNYTNTNDKIYVRNGEGTFLKFYFEGRNEKRDWFEENNILSLNPEKYLEMTNNNPNRIFFVSIPDFKDTFLGNIANATQIGRPGNFNIYKLNFFKKSPLIAEQKEQENWEYYDDFRSAKYLSDAIEWENISLSYMGNFNLPNTYGYYNLSPLGNNKPSFIDYRIVLTKGFKPPIIRPSFTLSNGSTIEIYGGFDQTKLQKIYEKTASQNIYFSPTILTSQQLFTQKSNQIYLRIIFKHDPKINFRVGDDSLKSILLTTSNRRGVFDFDHGDGDTLTFRSQLELTRSNSWLYDTTENYGWIQATDGPLFNKYDDSGNSPLVYKFSFPKQISRINTDFKIYASDNEEVVSISTDGDNWTELFHDNEGVVKNIQTDHKLSPTSLLFVKIQCRKIGPTCQLRDMKLTAYK